MFDSALDKEMALNEIETELERIDEEISEAQDAKQDADAVSQRMSRRIGACQKKRARREKYLRTLRKIPISSESAQVDCDC